MNSPMAYLVFQKKKKNATSKKEGSSDDFGLVYYSIGSTGISEKKTAKTR